MTQIDSRQDINELLVALRAADRVRSDANGSRGVRPTTVLARLSTILPKIGVTRVADISHLSPLRFPVSQCARPRLCAHASIGQNTGGQGRGLRADHARISAIMESLEAFSAEPRNEELVRASYAFLSHAHRVVDPALYARSLDVAAPAEDAPIMWTRGVSLAARCPVMLPAQCVFFPFFPEDYDTRSYFPTSSNGLAAGSTYLEALVHALYEVIERHYWGSWQTGGATIEALDESAIDLPCLARLKEELPGVELQLFAVMLPGIENVATVYCQLVGDSARFCGWGCQPSVDKAIEKAVSEAAQAIAVAASGTREDIERERLDQHDDDSAHRAFLEADARLPRYRTLRMRDFRERTVDRRFRTLRQELRFLVQWCLAAGFRDVLAANLTRVGVDVPVVRVVVPGMVPAVETRNVVEWTTPLVNYKRYAGDLRQDYRVA
jgi:YcaO-like protein with predicted kinase domain